MYSLGEILLPDDEKWHLHTFKLKKSLTETLRRKILFLVNDNKNYHGPDRHYGCSISYAKLFCENHSSISLTNLRTNPLSHPNIDHEVILIMCPVSDVTMPPLSIACIASDLRSKGIDPFILDFNIESYLKASFHYQSHERALWEDGTTALRWNEPEFVQNVLKRLDKRIDEVVKEIAQSKAKVVAFSIYSTNVRVSAVLSERLKKSSPDKTIVFGGPGVLFSAASGILGGGWDYLVIGDGETTLYNIITNKRDSFRGIVTRSEFTKVDLMSKRYSEPDLNALPLLDYEGFDLHRYVYRWKMPAYTSRGCWRRCPYCFDWNYYFPYRYLKGEVAFKHLINLYYKYGRKYFEVSDLLCNGNLSSVSKMAKMLRRARKGIKWGGFAIIHPDMTDSFLKDLKAGGCDYLRYGFETGSEKLLRRMRRGYTTEAASKIIKRTKNAGIRVHINILLGLPGEMDDTVEETLNSLRLNAAYIDVVDSVNVISIMPDTELLKKADTFDIKLERETQSWKIGQHGIKKHQEWAQKVLAALKEYGITCEGGMIPGACKGGF